MNTYVHMNIYMHMHEGKQRPRYVRATLYRCQYIHMHIHECIYCIYTYVLYTHI